MSIEHNNITLEKKLQVLEETTNSIHSMSVSIAIICEQLQTQAKGIDCIGEKIENLNNKVVGIELDPAKVYNSIKNQVVTVIVNTVVTLAIGGLVWAIIQSQI